MGFLFSPPSPDDLIHLLKAWRFWVLGAILGALVGAAMYYVVPPPHRARATVLVDFNLEEAWPEETDRQQFYYLERETRKLEEIAWSDDVMNVISAELDISVEELRGEKLKLSQPAEGGWHFYATDPNGDVAEILATTWAQLFADTVTRKVLQSQGLNSFIEAEVTQIARLDAGQQIPFSTYLLIGAVGFLATSAFLVLFFSKAK